MKKLLLILLTTALLYIGLAGCANPWENAAQNSLDGQVETSDNMTTSQTSEDGPAEIGAGKWPDYEMAQNIPEFKKAQVVSAVQANNIVMITLDKIDAGAFDTYFQEIKAVFTQDAVESTINGVLTFVGTNADNIGVSIYYAPEEGEAVINVGPNAQ